MSSFDVATYRKLDARLSQKPSSRSYVVNASGSQITSRREPSNSSNNNSTITFQLTPNSPNNVIDRAFIVEVDVDITFQGNGNGTNLLHPNMDGPRSFSNICQSSQLSINGLTISQETQSFYHALQHFNGLEEMVKYMSLSPGLMSPDFLQEYADGLGSDMNSLNDYKNSTRGHIGRGSYPFEVVSNTENSAQVRFKVYDYLTLSPMVYDDSLVPGLTNVTSLQLSFTLQNLARIWSHGEPNNNQITSAQVNIGQAFVHFTEISMPVYLTPPPVATLAYYDIQRQTSNNNVLLQPGASTVIQSNTYQLNQVPTRIMIYAKETDSNIYSSVRNQVSKPDAYATINKVDIQYNNQASILSSASQQQLFQISSRNGVDMSYPEWVGETQILSSVIGESTEQLPLTGSILCLDFGKDISSDPTALPSVSVNANFSLKLDITNKSKSAKNYDLTILYVYQGAIIISPGKAFKYTSALTREQVLSLPLIEGSEADNISGGDFKGFMKKVKSGLGTAAKYLKPLITPGLDVLQTVATPYVGEPAATVGREAIRALTGYGVSGGDYYGDAGVMGGGVRGGQFVEKRSLKSRF